MSKAEREHSPKEPAPPSRSDAADPIVGRVINDRFKVVGLVARGGMGKVYRAEQAPLGREVALKVLNPSYHGDHDPEFHKRFFLEASICSKLTHPNTVTIFDYGRTDDDVYYIAMELLEGRTLHRALREEQRLPPDRAMHIARQMCRSLREAHSLGVIHRDLKPANIFLVRHGDESDFVKVLDFGLVKDIGDKGEDLTQTGLFMGSPKYMAPEQIRGDDVDSRTDIYALGVILYEMLCGKVPFDRPNSVNILMAHVHEDAPSMQEMAPDLALDARVEEIVMRCMAKEPADRFSSMDELLVTLKHVAAATGLSHSSELGLSAELALGGGSTGAFGAVRMSSAPPPPAHSSPSEFTPPIAADPSMELDAPARRGPFLFVAGALLIAALVGGFFALRERPTEQEAAPTPLPPVVAEEPGMDVPARVMVSLRSEPPGARVVVGERTYGPTPAEVEWTGDDALEGREVTFRFELDGHRDFTVTRTVAGETLAVNASLDPVRNTSRMVRRPPRPRTGMMSAMQEGASVGLEGYKAEPY